MAKADDSFKCGIENFEDKCWLGDVMGMNYCQDKCTAIYLLNRRTDEER